MWVHRQQYMLWKFVDDPSSSRAAKIFSMFIMLVIALSVLSFTLESVPKNCRYVDKTATLIDENNVTVEYMSDSPKRLCEKPQPNAEPYSSIEFFCIVVFTLEYLMRICSCCAGPGLLHFLVAPMNVVDLAAILPWYISKFIGSAIKGLSVLRVLRLTRVLRIFKMGRNFQGLILLLHTFKRSAAALLMLVFFVGLSLIVFATLIFHAESGTWDAHRKQYLRADGQQTPFESIPSSMWWCIVTMTTVGYGDHYPITWPGKLVAILTMFCGLLVLSLPITIIGANFDELYRDMRKKEVEEKARKKSELMHKRLEHSHSDPTSSNHISSFMAACQVTAVRNGLAAKFARKAGASSTSSTDAAPVAGELPAHVVPTDANQKERVLRAVHELILQSHTNLMDDVEKVLEKHERELRLQIKALLATHSKGINQQTPLESMEHIIKCRLPTG